ncbi:MULTISPECIES: flavin reductase family protein [unclassified Streptomyces]|uniref:flavin reductase family protein n=1 Tax=unclassified Streptomyces TaxID=2593676 RepID=UPI002E822C03|nr:flavin reductase family protein [Streptomyces sp. NBC_00589]WTI41415.1 flavin reductase family protein [Streptomyces sp. NBC_00775]WUB24901.1 flavin reductase family protein [Streptomyces sp. NBC_00589]
MTTASTGVDRILLRDSLSRWPSGVAVVTTVDAAGVRRGFTATAFSSLSLEPPLVLVCLDRTADCRPAFDTAEVMAVHLLREDQAHLAQRFATKNIDKYDGLPASEGLRGVPLLGGVVARIECELDRRIDAGDHVILVGLVRRCEVFAGRPLVYFARAFHGLQTGSPHSQTREAETHAHDEHDAHRSPGGHGAGGGRGQGG